MKIANRKLQSVRRNSNHFAFCNLHFTPAAEGHGLCPWMNAPAFGRDVAPLGREVGATGYARGAPLSYRAP